jgi:O2-independent ubiquinone biosynthesis protein UbiV
MEVMVGVEKGEITLGPVLFNWPGERWRDFYFRIADEAPVSTVTIGEAICSKRDPLLEPHYAEVAERLAAAGKTVVFTTLAEVVLKHDRTLVERTCGRTDYLVEANDGSALSYLSGRPHHIGPFMNVYNERTAAFLAARGARNFCLPPEMPAAAIAALCDAAHEFDASIEVQVFGRLPLALSARCYHARAHGHTKDSCQYVCENDAHGMVLTTLDGRPFLTVNGIQTLSYDYLNLIGELPNLRNIGVSRFRLSPHDCDMVAVASLFRAALDQRMETSEAVAKLEAMPLGAPFSNGFYYGKPGYSWKAPALH